MHELSICRAIADIVHRHAADHPVETVHIRVGQLRQIVPDTLVHCWALVTHGTALADSTLDVESVPAEIRCRHCDHSQKLTAPIFICDLCTGTDVEIVAGEEFLITSLELTEA